jgi:hypothetical protein
MLDAVCEMRVALAFSGFTGTPCGEQCPSSTWRPVGAATMRLRTEEPGVRVGGLGLGVTHAPREFCIGAVRNSRRHLARVVELYKAYLLFFTVSVCASSGWGLSVNAPPPTHTPPPAPLEKLCVAFSASPLTVAPLVAVADAAQRDTCRIFGAFVAFNTHPGFRVVCSAIQNIDAEVLLAGTDTMSHLLAAYPRGMCIHHHRHLWAHSRLLRAELMYRAAAGSRACVLYPRSIQCLCGVCTWHASSVHEL